MACKRKSSQVVSDAQTRAANLKAIDQNLDLGNDLSLEGVAAKITAVQAALDEDNAQLAKADAAGNGFKTLEQELRFLPSRMLAGVGVKYGKDSNE